MKRTMALFLALALLLLTACGGPAYQAEELKGDASAAPAASAETDLHGAVELPGYGVKIYKMG